MADVKLSITPERALLPYFNEHSFAVASESLGIEGVGVSTLFIKPLSEMLRVFWINKQLPCFRSNTKTYATDE